MRPQKTSTVIAFVIHPGLVYFPGIWWVRREFFRPNQSPPNFPARPLLLAYFGVSYRPIPENTPEALGILSRPHTRVLARVSWGRKSSVGCRRRRRWSRPKRPARTPPSGRRRRTSCPPPATASSVLPFITLPSRPDLWTHSSRKH